MEEQQPDIRTVIAGRVGLLALWLIAWEIIGRTNPVLLSSPSLVFSTFARMIVDQNMLHLLLASGKTFIVGWAFAVGLGLILGVLIGWSRPIGLMLEPFLNALNSTPLLALVPLMVLWFGLELKAMVVCVTLIAVFPMMIMTITGVRNAGRDYIEVARSFRLSPLGILFKVVLPGALPFIYVGLRLATVRSLSGTIIAEFLIPGDGIGNALRAAGDAFNADQMYTFIVTITVLAMLLDVAVRRSGRRLTSSRFGA